MGRSGRCLCGAVVVTAVGDPVSTRQCWCRQCQQIAAGGPTHNAIFLAENVAITGELTSGKWRAASGNVLTFYFCPLCGTQIYGQSSARLHLKTVRIGALGDPSGLRPQIAIWTDDAPDWALIDPELERWPQQPPAQPPTPLGAG